jgi:hypothetical protein
VSKAIKNYRRANSPEHSLWQFVETPAGAGFVFRESRNYHPKADLLAIAMAISTRLKAGRYLPDDPTIGSGLPAVWFAPEERRRWRVDVEDAGADVSFHARLRPGTDIDPSDQLLMVFLADAHSGTGRCTRVGRPGSDERRRRRFGDLGGESCAPRRRRVDPAGRAQFRNAGQCA